jgi:ubiquinone/menaquinone biosynthesis C-methylase UbiE
MNDTQIKLLPVELIAENPQIVSDIELLSKGLFKEIGWHYAVDLTWVVKSLRERNIQPGATVLDAGAGSGLLQYLLALYGYNVVSVDFSPRSPNLFTRHLFNPGQYGNGADFSSPYISHVKEVSSFRHKLKKLRFSIKTGQINLLSFPKLELKLAASKIKPGKINYLQADMSDMKSIPSGSIDAIVSVSAIEHMEKEAIKATVEEFNRVLKPDQPMIITTSAAEHEDWFHQASEGWCFSRQTLSDLFEESGKSGQGYEDYEARLSEYRDNAYLKNHLAGNYFISGNNGMPWGAWDPKYIPAGIIAIKPAG